LGGRHSKAMVKTERRKAAGLTRGGFDPTIISRVKDKLQERWRGLFLDGGRGAKWGGRTGAWVLEASPKNKKKLETVMYFRGF